MEQLACELRTAEEDFKQAEVKKILTQGQKEKGAF